MSLTDSNTYVEPSGGTALNTSRGQYNKTLRALLANFKGAAIPDTENIISEGAGLGEVSGMLHYYSNANISAFYVSDAATKKHAPIGGNFTRAGIGHKLENGITALAANVSFYEIGELAVTVQQGAGTSNARLYLIAANNRTMADVVDVGIPPTNSVTSAMLKDAAITPVKLDLLESTGDYNGGANSLLKVGSAAGNTSIGLGINNSSNVSIKYIRNGTGANAGITVVGSNGLDLAPITANVVYQSKITGVNTQGTAVPLIPAGIICAYGGASSPEGWLKCDGAAANTDTYSALFGAIGYTYGGSAGTFNLPDLRGKALYGADATFVLGADSGVTLDAQGDRTSTSVDLEALESNSYLDVLTSAKDSLVVGNVLANVSYSVFDVDVRFPAVAASYIIKT